MLIPVSSQNFPKTLPCTYLGAFLFELVVGHEDSHFWGGGGELYHSRYVLLLLAFLIPSEVYTLRVSFKIWGGKKNKDSVPVLGISSGSWTEPGIFSSLAEKNYRRQNKKSPCLILLWQAFYCLKRKLKQLLEWLNNKVKRCFFLQLQRAQTTWKNASQISSICMPYTTLSMTGEGWILNSFS